MKKTKSLTFLLALTFLFLFSGSVYGGVFDKEDESAVFTCKTTYNLYWVNRNEKAITEFTLWGDVNRIFKINEDNQVMVKGISEKGDKISLHKHSYFDKDKTAVELSDYMGSVDGKVRKKCFVGDKKF